MLINNNLQRIVWEKIKNPDDTCRKGRGEKMQNVSDLRSENNSESSLIIHGDNWPLVEGLCQIGGRMVTEYRIYASHTPRELFTLLYEHPDAMLTLCLKPREHLFLFYALSAFFRHTPATVLCDSFYFSDHVVMDMWNCFPVNRSTWCSLRNEESPEIWRLFLTYLTTCRKLKKQLAPLFVGIVYDENDFIEIMNQCLLEHIIRAGVSVFQVKILQAILEGKTISCIAKSMGVNEGKIKNHKIMMFSRLNTPSAPHALLFGMKYHLGLQRTLFKEINKSCVMTNKEVLSDWVP